MSAVERRIARLAQIARVIARRLIPLSVDRRRSSPSGWRGSEAREAAALGGNVVPFQRTPYFCSGCPHNTSTKVPEGSRALAGIGCHWLSQFMDRSYSRPSARWAAKARRGSANRRLSRRTHVFANIGDGTYTHSGILAIRAAVAAKVNMTYKVLFNDAVAMTGGQPLDGSLTVPRVAVQLAAEGVRQVVIVSDEPDKYPIGTEFPPGSTVRHRDDLDLKSSATLRGNSRASARSSMTRPAPPRSAAAGSAAAFPTRRSASCINDLVCEGCGDCSTASNCLVGRAGRDRVRPQTARSTSRAATRISPASKGSAQAL